MLETSEDNRDLRQVISSIFYGTEQVYIYILPLYLLSLIIHINYILSRTYFADFSNVNYTFFYFITCYF